MQPVCEHILAATGMLAPFDYGAVQEDCWEDNCADRTEGLSQLGEPRTSSITPLAPLSRIAAFCYAQHCMQTQPPCYAA